MMNNIYITGNCHGGRVQEIRPYVLHFLRGQLLLVIAVL